MYTYTTATASSTSQLRVDHLHASEPSVTSLTSDRNPRFFQSLPTVLVSSDALYPAKDEAARCHDGEYVPWPLFPNATESRWFRAWNRGLYRQGLTKSFGGE